MPPVPRVASTVILLRPHRGGFHVFMVQRHRKSGFMPSAWVFPGGRTELADELIGHPRVRGGAGTAATFGIPEAQAMAVMVGAVRETFEESGIWLGTGSVADHHRPALAGGDMDLPGLLDHHDVTLELDHLRPWARWVTPEQEPKRYDTAFFVAVVDEQGGSHDNHETVDSGWFDPAEVLGRGLEAFVLAPPTWWTLTELAALNDEADLSTLLAGRDFSPVRPVFVTRDKGLALLLPGDPEHPDPARPGLPTSVVSGADHWVAVGL